MNENLTHEQYRLVVMGMIIGAHLATGPSVGISRFHDAILPDILTDWGFSNVVRVDDLDAIFERIYVDIHSILQKNHPDLVAPGTSLFEKDPSKRN